MAVLEPPERTHRSSAWPLALLFTATVVYASLYPFEGWRLQGVSPTAFLFAPLPQYWTVFDLVSNLLGYAPLGFLLALGTLREGWGRWSWLGALGLPVLLSLAVEMLQSLLPMRIPSNVDWALNSAGAALGAGMVWWLRRLGGVRRWSQFRRDWFAPSARGSLVLLALWPLALLYPASIPFGLGQVAERLETALVQWLQGTPFLDWLPVRQFEAAPLSPLAQALCVGLGVLAPLLVGYTDIRSWHQRAVFLPVLLLLAGAAGSLSATLTYGPTHAWAWMNPPAALGLAFAVVFGIVLLPAPRQLCNVVMILCLAVTLSWLNRAPETPYFAQSLEPWEQGRFIRFHGVTQWLGWMWPFGALFHAVLRAARLPAEDKRGV